MTHLGPVEPLVCVVCVAGVEATSDAAEGWVLVHHSTADDDDQDDSQWKCPLHATGSDEFFGDASRLELEGVA